MHMPVQYTDHLALASKHLILLKFLYFQVGVFVYDKNNDSLHSRDTAPAHVTPTLHHQEKRDALKEERVAADDARQTPVDLSDIVEKLNTAIKDCRVKNVVVDDDD